MISGRAGRVDVRALDPPGVWWRTAAPAEGVLPHSAVRRGVFARCAYSCERRRRSVCSYAPAPFGSRSRPRSLVAPRPSVAPRGVASAARRTVGRGRTSCSCGARGTQCGPSARMRPAIRPDSCTGPRARAEVRSSCASTNRRPRSASRSSSTSRRPARRRTGSRREPRGRHRHRNVGCRRHRLVRDVRRRRARRRGRDRRPRSRTAPCARECRRAGVAARRLGRPNGCTHESHPIAADRGRGKRREACGPAGRARLPHRRHPGRARARAPSAGSRPSTRTSRG